MFENFKYNDGGRKASGRKGDAGDCVVRAIAIAGELDYEVVYKALAEKNEWYLKTKRDKYSRILQQKGKTPRNGNFKKIYHEYIESLGFKWVATMEFGKGCTTHLKADELPKGRIICRLSHHLSAVIEGVINDTHDPSRGGTRCVYGYYIKEVG